MVLSVHKTIRLIRDGEKGEGVWRGWKRKIIYLSLRCHHQNDFCIEAGSSESHLKCLINCEGQSHKTVSTSHHLFKKKGDPKRKGAEALPLTSLGQTG